MDRILRSRLPIFFAMMFAIMNDSTAQPTPRTFAGDVELMRKHTEIIVLSDEAGAAQVAIAPAWQGRVMTSTLAGPDAQSLGWINDEAIASGEIRPHINLYGGEERFWLGPEGGQFALFFPPGAPFELAHWQTPPLIDTEPFETLAKQTDRADFARKAQIRNRAGSLFDLSIQREIRLIGPDQAAAQIGAALPANGRIVAYETSNKVTNAGQGAWTKETGLISIWILGMYPASKMAVIAIPVKPGSEAELGPAVNDDYFADLDKTRLKVVGNTVFFRADAQYRSKIGIPPRRATPWLGGYDRLSGVLTLVHYTLPENAKDYVDSSWKEQEKPFGGDVVNAYNDGPPAPGAKQLGSFFELESSSPGLALGHGESYTHTHRTYHLQGSQSELDPIARAVLGVGIEEIKSAFAANELK